MQASRLLRCDAGHKQHPSSSFCFRSTNVSPMKNYNFGWGPNFLKTPSSFISMFYDLHRSVHVVRIQRCLTKTVSSISFSDLSPIENYNFRIFSMGPKLYRVTIFCGSHVPNFLQTPSSLLLLFSDLQQPPTCSSHAQDAPPEFRLHSVLSTSNQHCVDLSPIENYIFRWGPNFIIESPCSLAPMLQTFWTHHLLWFCCFPTCNGRLHVVRMRTMPHQNLDPITFFPPQVNAVSI